MFLSTQTDADASLKDINLTKPEDNPTDSVSCISWSPSSNMNWFACADWDSKIRVYDVNTSESSKGISQKVCFNMEDPCLSISWEEDMSKLYAGCIDNSIKILDMMTGKSTQAGTHEGAVKDVYWLPSLNTICSLSYDRTMKLWDPRQQTPLASFHLAHKVYCSDLLFPKLVIGLSEERILLVNLTEAHQVLTRYPLDCVMESPLGIGAQLTSIGFFADGNGIGVASHEGRANLSRFENQLFGTMRLGSIMTFKCHKSDSPPILYPVHAIGFNPRSPHFLYTAGGDGSLTFWDYEAKNKIKSFSYKGVPVTKAKLSPDGKLIAYSLGYDWAKGIEGSKSIKSKVCIHEIAENELVYSR